MKRLIACGLTSFLLTSPLAAEDLTHLQQTAEVALLKFDYPTAKEAYKKLFERIDCNKKYRLDWAYYLDVAARLAKVHLALGEYAEGEIVLASVLARNPPDAFSSTVHALYARILAGQNKSGAAFVHLQTYAAKCSPEIWQGVDRSFFRGLEYLLNAYYDGLMHKARRFLAAGAYAQAAAMYEELLDAIAKKYYPKGDTLVEKKIRYHLAETYFFQAQFEKTIALFSPDVHPADEIDRQMLYLAANTYKEKHEYEKAIDCFQNYIQAGDEVDLAFYDHALLEIGLFHFRQGNPARAEKYFDNLVKLKKQTKARAVGILYLSRIYVQDGRSRDAENLLSTLTESLPNEDPLQREIAFLRGEAAFACKDFAHAADFFEHALPSGQTLVDWQGGTLLRLSESYIQLADDPLKGKRAKEEFLTKAEKILFALLNTKEREPATLALCRLFLLRDYHLDDEEALLMVDKLLSESTVHFSLPGQIEALLLRAQARKSDTVVERLFLEATSEQYRTTPLYPYAWWSLGLYYFEKGMQANAIAAFEKAFFLFNHETKAKSNLLKWEALATFTQGKPLEALALLDKSLTHYPITPQQNEELLYIRGLIAARLGNEYAPLALESLRSVAKCHMAHADDALFAMATFHYKKEAWQEAKEIFLELVATHPRSPVVGSSLFWAAECSEKMHEAPAIAADLRRRVYTDFPDGEHADEAYFRLYALDAYLRGEKEAIAHLASFQERFPRSPIGTPVFFLLGLASHGDEAKKHFENAVALFDRASVDPQAKDPAFVYFRYRAVLEEARLALHEGRDAESAMEGVHLLLTLLAEFRQSDHPLTHLLTKESPYPSILEESEYTLALLYLKLGRRHKAQETLALMLAHYDAAGIREGATLALVWIEQAKLAITTQDYDTALHALAIAEASGKALPAEQLLSLWMLESDCYRGKKEYDLAIKMLSKAVNANVASNVRLQAMLKRAELYELEGRKELAIRQLEATAKKGGPWGQEATERLKVNYGIQ